jgi:hypothetical protein
MLKIVFLCFLVAAINAQSGNDDILCEGRTFEPNCTVGTIQIVTAGYGKSDSWFCGGPQRQPWSTNCVVDVTQAVRTTCQDKQTCSMRVEGADSCAGFAKYLRVIWSCFNGNVQSRVNSKSANIMVSATANRANPAALHGLNVGGSNLYVFVDPQGGIQQVRWYLDNTGSVFTTETAAPWDLLGGRPWDTVGSRVTDGQHKIIAAITFTDGSNGYVDAIFNVRNGNNVARATEKTQTEFVDSNPNTNSTGTPVYTESHVVPWSLFGTTVAVIIALSVVIGVMDKRKKAVLERA